MDPAEVDGLVDRPEVVAALLGDPVGDYRRGERLEVRLVLGVFA